MKLTLALALTLAAPVQAQDTSQAYPWRLSYFPYITASPNDGVMAMGRVLFFRQSRWDDRASLHSGVAIEGGYSTKNSWLARVRGDFPRLADGWRVQASVEAAKLGMYVGDASATRQLASVDVTRHVDGPVSVALRGDVSHLVVGSFSATSEIELRGRVALVLDFRDREYDTHNGALIQGGGFLGSTNGMKGWYALAAGWVPLSEKTRVTARGGVRIGDHLTSEGTRTMPAWEDAFVLGGGPESNRALVAGSKTNTKMMLASAELRHDLVTFPGGALALLAFVDGSREYCDCAYFAEHKEWTVGPGAGASLRLLRNAILTATVARADGATRVYVSSGWSW